MALVRVIRSRNRTYRIYSPPLRKRWRVPPVAQFLAVAGLSAFCTYYYQHYGLPSLPNLSLARFDVSSPRQTVSEQFIPCGLVRRTCVVDGDTIWLGGVKIRILGMDTPEISEPKCASEKALGLKAKARLVVWLNEGSFEMVANGDRDQDVYGRKLRDLQRNGRSVSSVLIAEGLAAPWAGSHHYWCG